MPARLGPGGWPCHPTLDRSLHDFHGGCGRRVNHCAEEGRRPRHTESFVFEAKDCRHYSIGVFSARGCCLTRWRLQGMFTPCRPRQSRHDAKGIIPGARHKGRRAFLPLATIQPRTARTPRSFLKYTRNGFSLSDRQVNDRSGHQ